jgi:hypothetical protein
MIYDFKHKNCFLTDKNFDLTPSHAYLHSQTQQKKFSPADRKYRFAYGKVLFMPEIISLTVRKIEIALKNKVF